MSVIANRVLADKSMNSLKCVGTSRRAECLDPDFVFCCFCKDLVRTLMDFLMYALRFCKAHKFRI